MRLAPRVTDMTCPPFDVLNTRAAQLRSDGHRVITLGQALPPFGPPPSVLKAAREGLAGDEVHVYSADAGRPSLREAVADQLARSHHIRCAAGELIITAGANQAFMLAMMTLVEPGDEVLLPAPYFVNHEMAVRAVGAIPVEIALAEDTGFSLRWQDIESHLTSRSRAVVLCNPSNPTGATIGALEGSRIVRELAQRGVALVSDETYMHFVYDGAHWSAASVAAWRENVIVINSFSKSFGMTGWRIGYMLADRRACDQALKIQDAMVICAPVISQIAVEPAVREHWTYAHAFHQQLIERRQAFVEGLKGIPRLRWVPTNGGFFALVRISGCEDSAIFADELLERAHVLVIPGAVFGRCGQGFVRVSYGSVSHQDLDEALVRLRSFCAA